MLMHNIAFSQHKQILYLLLKMFMITELLWRPVLSALCHFGSLNRHNPECCQIQIIYPRNVLDIFQYK